MSELNVYVVLINCCIGVCGGNNMNVLEMKPEPDIYIEDLINRGWSNLDANFFIRVLEKKGLVRFGQFNESDNCYKGLYLTQVWRELYGIWPQVNRLTANIDKPVYQQSFNW